MIDPVTVIEGLKTVGSLLLREDVQKTLFGTYSNGKPRSFVDAWDGELLSPKDRSKKIYKKRKSGKKKIRL